ncbi:MAG: FAD-binding and (Fe-S)-binding domain-containing protein, partial [Planctomycetia bacterium]
VFAEAVLATLPIPRHRGLVVAGFSSLDAAASVGLECLEFQPTACELIDRRLMRVVRESSPAFQNWAPQAAEALLLVEQEGATAANTRDRLRLLAERLGRSRAAVGAPAIVTSEADIALAWESRHRATARLALTSKRGQPIPLIENTAVPPARLPSFLKRLQTILQRHGLTASYTAHIGVGVVHARPIMELQRPEQLSQLEPLMQEVLAAVLEHGGTNNGEHGVGLLRSHLLPRQYPRLYRAFRQIKEIFDPNHILNPGRLVGAPGVFPARHLRTSHTAADLAAPPTGRAPTVRAPTGGDAPPSSNGAVRASSLLLERELPVLEQASRCNGCGSCQSVRPAARMCPSFRAFGNETSSPRAQVNLLRQVLAGQLDPRLLSSNDLREVADRCINCKMCKTECPSGVDVATLMLEVKAANVAEQGMARGDAFFARLELWAGWASANAWFVNSLLGNPGVRWAMEKWVGIARERRLPRFHHRTFLQRAASLGWSRRPELRGDGRLDPKAKPRVAYFVDSFTNHNDPALGETVVRVLRHLGCSVYVPPGQFPSGMAALAYGDVETARRLLAANVKLLVDLVRDGFTVVCTEPTSALMFRADGRLLSDDAELALVADHTFEFSEFLSLEFAAGRLEPRPPSAALPVTVGYHEPCHQRALNPKAALEPLLEQAPGLRVTRFDLGCSGMAGT